MQALRVLLAALVLLAGCASVVSDDDDDDEAEKSPDAVARFPQPVSVGWIIGRTVLEPVESQPVLGRISGVVKTIDGTTSVVVDYGGIFGFGARPIAVPVTAIALLGTYVEIVGYKPAELRGFPTFRALGSAALPAEAVIKVGLARPSH